MKQNVKYMLLCAVIAVVASWAGHWYGSRLRSIVRVPETITVHDTIYPKIPDPIVITKEIPAGVDTAAILASYFAEKHYHDTIIERPYLRVELTDVISRNSLLNRTMIVDYRQPIVYNNTLILGADIGRSYYALVAGYRRKSWEFKAGYDFYNKSLVFGVSKDLWQW